MEIQYATYLTETILAGVVYDFVKAGVILSVDSLKQGLKNWLIDDISLANISNQLANLEINDEMSEKAIERKISNSIELMELLKTIKPSTENNMIIQNHSGSGDNIGRDKIINN